MTFIRTALALCLAWVATASVPALTPRGARVTVAAEVLVTGAGEKPVTTLTAEDFVLESNGAPLPIVKCVPPPLTLSAVLMIDRSRSTAWSSADFQKTVDGFVAALDPGERGRLGAFARSIRLSPPLVISDPRKVSSEMAAVFGAVGGQPSPVWDAVDASVTALTADDGTRTLFLVTDGQASANRIGLSDAGIHAAMEDVTISAVAEGPQRVLQQSGNLAVVQPDAPLRWLTSLTGGIFIPWEAPRDPVTGRESVDELRRNVPARRAALLADAVRAMRQRYRLEFEAEAGKQLRPLTVRVGKPGLTVRARQAYIARQP